MHTPTSQKGYAQSPQLRAALCAYFQPFSPVKRIQKTADDTPVSCTARSSGAGFTIVELIVVVTIIGLLVAIVSVNILDSRAKARDTKRAADLEQVHLALKSFHSLYGRYPSSTDGDCDSDESFQAGGCLEALVTIGIFTELPIDPDSSRQYYYDNWCESPGPGSDEQQFRMWANGERNNDGTTYGWAEDTDIGITLCADPTS